MRVEGRAVAIFRVGDEVFALDNNCPHWGGPLVDGSISIERTEVTCPWHRFRYCLRTGRNVVSKLRNTVQTYPIERRENEIHLKK